MKGIKTSNIGLVKMKHWYYRLPQRLGVGLPSTLMLFCTDFRTYRGLIFFIISTFAKHKTRIGGHPHELFAEGRSQRRGHIQAFQGGHGEINTPERSTSDKLRLLREPLTVGKARLSLHAACA